MTAGSEEAVLCQHTVQVQSSMQHWLAKVMVGSCLPGCWLLFDAYSAPHEMSAPQSVARRGAGMALAARTLLQLECTEGRQAAVSYCIKLNAVEPNPLRYIGCEFACDAP